MRKKEESSKVKGNPEIEQLVVKAIRGNRDALLALCEKVARNVLFRVSYKLRKPEDSEDVAQEVLIRMCENIHNLKDPKAFQGWLNTIIMNETRRHLTKNTKQQNVIYIDEYEDTEDFDEEDDDILPEDFAVKEEDRKLVMEIIDLLPERQREAIILHYYEEMTITEIAQAMGVAKSNVFRYLSLARDKIKGEVEGYAEKTGTLYGLASLPIGSLLSSVLKNNQGMSFGTDGTWVNHTMSSVTEVVGNVARKGLIFGSGFSGLTVAISTGAVAVAVTAGLLIGGVFPARNLSAEDTPSDNNAIASVQFISTDSRFDYINPIGATVETGSDYGELIIKNWKITKANDETILYSENGSNPDEALKILSNNNEKGEYLITYLLEDSAGRKYTLSRNFVIQ